MKTAIVFGSTGLIGGHLVNQLIQDNYYTKIKIFVRSQTSINNEKVLYVKKCLSASGLLDLDFYKK